MASLRRTMAAGFTPENTYWDWGELPTMDWILQSKCPEELLLPVDHLFKDLPPVTIVGRSVTLARNGAPFPAKAPQGAMSTWHDGGLCRVYDGPQGEFLAVGRYVGKEIKIVKSFFEVRP